MNNQRPSYLDPSKEPHTRMQCGTDTTVCGIQGCQSVREDWNRVPDGRSTQFARVLHVKMIVGNSYRIAAAFQNTKYVPASEKCLNRKGYTWKFLVARDISHRFRNKLVAILSKSRLSIVYFSKLLQGGHTQHVHK